MSCFIGWDSTYANTEREREQTKKKGRHIEHINHTPCCTHLHRPKTGQPVGQLGRSSIVQFATSAALQSVSPPAPPPPTLSFSACQYANRAATIRVSVCLSVCVRVCKSFRSCSGALLTSAYANTSPLPPHTP